MFNPDQTDWDQWHTIRQQEAVWYELKVNRDQTILIWLAFNCQRKFNQADPDQYV